MKKFKYLIGLALLAVTAGFTSCQDDVDEPAMNSPVASKQANTTIKELKEQYWQDAVNYIDTIGTKDDGSHVIIKGRVVSSDEASNVFKNLVIQDETGALTLSIDSYNLYLNYRVGQEIVIDATGMYIGKYAGLMQLGMPSKYLDGWQASFMSREFFTVHSELNGLPEPAKIDTIVIDSFDELVKNKDSFIKNQSQFVRFNNVKFKNGGTATFSTYHANGNQDLVDGNGNGADNTILTVRTSGYSNFWNKTVPAGYGDICGILSYYDNGSSSNWQLILNKYEDVMNFGNPTLPKGTKDTPYSVNEVVSFANAGNAKEGWMTGYIVGAIAPEVTTVSSNADIEWGANVTLNNTLVIASEAGIKDFDKCVVIELPQGSSLRSLGNLRDNPANLGKQIWLKGRFEKVLGMAGVAGNNGSSSEYEIEGVQAPIENAVNGLNEGFEGAAIPANWTQVQLAGNKSWYTPSFDNNYYAAMTGYKGTAPFDQWLISPAVDMSKVTNKNLSFLSQVNGYGSTTTKLNVYVLNSADPTTASVKVKLNSTLATAPAEGYSGFVPSGNIDLSSYTGYIYIAFQYEASQDANYATWCIDDVKLGEVDPDTPDNPNPPVNPPSTESGKGDFNSFNGGTIKAQYGTYTNATGWTATNAQIIGGSDNGTNTNPNFAFISDNPATLAVLLNGKVGAAGSLLSPTLTGGIKTLTFNYGFPYTDTKAQLTINIKQNGSVVKTTKLNVTSAKFEACGFSWDANVTGDFVIEIVNDCISASTSNKDRVAIWNLDWTN